MSDWDSENGNGRWRGDEDLPKWSFADWIFLGLIIGMISLVIWSASQ